MRVRFDCFKNIKNFLQKKKSITRDLTEFPLGLRGWDWEKAKLQRRRRERWSEPEGEDERNERGGSGGKYWDNKQGKTRSSHSSCGFHGNHNLQRKSRPSDLEAMQAYSSHHHRHDSLSTPLLPFNAGFWSQRDSPFNFSGFSDKFTTTSSSLNPGDFENPTGRTRVL